MMKEPGKLIVLEGVDEVGKSTLARAVTRTLRKRGISCDCVSFPGSKPRSLGKLIHRIHHTPSRVGIKRPPALSLQALHTAAHLDVIPSEILPRLHDGRWVVLDRFWWSTLVYGRASGIRYQSLRKLIDLELMEWGDVQPDMIFLVQRRFSGSNKYLKRMGAMTKRYVHLSNLLSGKLAIRTVQNDSVIADALNHVLAAIDSLEKTSSELEVSASGKIKQDTFERTVRPIVRQLSPAKPSLVYDTYWRFAAERTQVFFRRLRGTPPPWTDDEILRRYRFTNSYRASDKVSQYLIRHVIYEGDQSPEEIVFRTLLFKIFNRIETWELMTEAVGEITFREFGFERYAKILEDAYEKGSKVYSAAYIMPSGKQFFKENRKHRAHLRLLEMMMRDELPFRLTDCRSMKQAFEMLRAYPSIGNFLGYQYLIDLNYSTVLNFSEMEFVVPGPGARSGIRKCFTDFGGLNDTEIIHMIAERQEEEFKRLGLEFLDLWGRPLQLVDCQNLFCEVDKYSRIAHPEIRGTSDRRRIKQKFRAGHRSLDCWFPPKWNLNHLTSVPAQRI